MVKFLLQRPIAVLMAFTACFIVGLVTYFSLPVSLLPDIAIPQITIQVTGENSSARELENLSAVSLLCGRIFPQHRTQSCNPGLHLVDPDLQPTVLIPKRNVFRIRLQGRNTGPRRVGSSSHDNDREGQK